jgi:hypothetical protein
MSIPGVTSDTSPPMPRPDDVQLENELFKFPVSVVSSNLNVAVSNTEGAAVVGVTVGVTVNVGVIVGVTVNVGVTVGDTVAAGVPVIA